MSDYELTIDLSELQSNETLSPEKLIFRPQYDTLLSLVKETLRANLEHVEQERKEKGNAADLTIIKRNPCFFIDGPRGSGKSTFLRTVRHELLNPPSGAFKYKLDSLCEVDPSELAPGEDFFVLILSRLCHLLEQKQRVRDMREDANYKKAVELLQKMSEGIKILPTGKDGISRALESESFLEESVEQCNSSAELKKHFAELMEKVCQIRGVQALLVTIDDADMGFDKCFKILEYVRIYMRCPHIIFIFTGDLKQYSLVVRGNLLRYFGEAALRYDYRCYERRMEVLDELTNQYLYKLFPIRSNVSLPSSIQLILNAENVIIEPAKKWALVCSAESEINEKDTSQQIQPTLRQFIFRTIRPYCGVRNYSGVFNLLGVMPLRTLLQFFQHLCFADKPASRDAYYDAIYGVSRNYLLANGVEETLIKAGNIIALMKAVLTYIANSNFSIESANLLIPEASFAKKMESLYLSAEVSRLINDWQWIIAYVCIVFPYYEGYKLMYHAQKVSMDGIKNEIAVSLNNSDVRGRCCNSTAHIAFALNLASKQKKFGMGVIALNGASANVKFHDGIVRYLSAADFAKKLIGAYSSAEDGLYILSIYFSLSRVEGEKGGGYCLSVFNLISSFISLIVATHGQNKGAVEEIVESDFMPRVFMAGNTMKRDIKIDVAVSPEEDDEEDIVNDTFFEWMRNLSLQDKKNILAPIVEWTEKINTDNIPSSPASLAQMWDFFKRQCSYITAQFKIKGYSEENVVSAHHLYSEYLRLFLDSLILVNPEEDCSIEWIKSFPLFKSIIEAENLTPGMMQITNKLNIAKITPIRPQEEENELAYMQEKLEELQKKKSKLVKLTKVEISELDGQDTNREELEKELKNVRKSIRSVRGKIRRILNK